MQSPQAPVRCIDDDRRAVVDESRGVPPRYQFREVCSCRRVLLDTPIFECCPRATIDSCTGRTFNGGYVELDRDEAWAALDLDEVRA